MSVAELLVTFQLQKNFDRAASCENSFSYPTVTHGRGKYMLKKDSLQTRNLEFSAELLRYVVRSLV